MIPQRQIEVRRGRGGVSIIEVLIATSLLAISLAGAYAMVTRTAAMMRQARSHYVATTLCLARIERARDIDYGLLPLLEEPSPGTTIDQEGVPASEGDFRRTTEVDVDSPVAGVTTVNVRMDIRDLRSRAFEGAFEEMTSMYTTYLTPP